MIRRRYTHINDAKLRELWPTRITYAELGKALGHHPKTLRRRAAKIGLPAQRRKLWRQQ